MKAKSIHGSSVLEIEKALSQAIVDDFKPTVAIVFISVKQDRKAIRKLFASKNIDVFGATSCGEFIEGVQTVGEIAVLLLELSKSHYKIQFEDIVDRSQDEAVSSLANKTLEQFTNPSLIVCSTGINLKGEFFEGDKMVSHLKQHLGLEKIFFGGMAGDDWGLNGTF